MNNLLNKLSQNAIFVIISGLASLISLAISFINDKQVLWFLLAINVFILIVVWRLVVQNTTILGRLDNLDFYIIQRDIELDGEVDDDKYLSKGDLVLALHTSLTQEALATQPEAIIEISYPSQLQIEYIFNNERVQKKTVSSDRVTLSVSLSHGISFITLRSINIDKEHETEFLKSSKEIIIKVSSNLLKEEKGEKIPVSLVG